MESSASVSFNVIVKGAAHLTQQQDCLSRSVQPPRFFAFFVLRYYFQVDISLRSLVPFDYWKNRFVSEQERSKSIIGILHVDGYWLGLPVPPVVADCAPPSLQFLNARMGNIGLAVERTNCGFIAEGAKICLDVRFSFPPVSRSPT